MPRKTFTEGEYIEFVADPASGSLPTNLWERGWYVERVERGRYKGWHWVHSDTTGQVCVPPRRIRKVREK